MANPRLHDRDQAELLNRFRRGDRDAFEQVFRQHYQPLRLNAFLILKNEQEAEDIVQQLFLDIWNQRLYAQLQQSLNAYLHISVKHRCFNYLRKTSNQTRKLTRYASELEAVSTHAVSDDAGMQPSPKLLGVLDELPLQQSKAFQLVHIEDKRYFEAAKEMGISINSLKTHLKLATKFLRIRLKAASLHPYNE